MKRVEYSETCPSCGQAIEPRASRADYSPWRLLVSLIPATLVETPGRVLFQLQCPFCGTEFYSRSIRYFGWLSYLRYRYILFAFFIVLLCAAWLALHK